MGFPSWAKAQVRVWEVFICWWLMHCWKLNDLQGNKLNRMEIKRM